MNSYESIPVEDVRNSTSMTIRWPDSACSLLEDSKDQFLQLAATCAHRYLPPLIGPKHGCF